MDRSQRPTWPGSEPVAMLRSGHCDLVRAWTGRNVAIWSVCGPVATLRTDPCGPVATLRPDPCGPVVTLRPDPCGPVATLRPAPCSVRSLCVDRFGYLSNVLGQLVFSGSIEAF
ncbi:hypothetical protein F2Q69_00007749 [Brassica cretica]|uniref:Uncharacterized protein n=1 Tax=Brassica cretica TaxID=69181 RepID=A0A8S9NZR4_BRACR|nr:hypothetical protein F2Q69_00007749 [Brassica cretica]